MTTAATTTTEHVVLKSALCELYIMHRKWADYEVAERNASVLSVHPTLADAGRESLRLQLEDSRLVREDAAAGGDMLNVVVIGVTIDGMTEQRGRTYHLYVQTPSGGTMRVTMGGEDIRCLADAARQPLTSLRPGSHTLPSIPITLRKVTELVRRDAQVARWMLAGVRRAYRGAAAELQPRDVLIVKGIRWIVHSFSVSDTSVNVSVAQFVGRAHIRRTDILHEMHFAAGEIINVERQRYQTH